MNLFQLGNFQLHSGQTSNFKIDCDSLTDSDIETIAFLIAERQPFGRVEGVPRGGLRLAAALEKYALPANKRKGRYGAKELLIVDDVWTTGNSMEKHRAGRDANGAVIFARGLTAWWVDPLFLMNSGDYYWED